MIHPPLTDLGPPESANTYLVAALWDEVTYDDGEACERLLWAERIIQDEPNADLSNLIGTLLPRLKCDIKITLPDLWAHAEEAARQVISQVFDLATYPLEASSTVVPRGTSLLAPIRDALSYWSVSDGHRATTPANDDWPWREGHPWHETAMGNPRRTYAGRTISRCIRREDRTEAYARWCHAEDRGTPFTRLLTIKLPTDHLSPVDRMKFWDGVRQRLRCWCRDCQIECVAMTARESRVDGTGEHIHVLIHVPEQHQAAFDRLAPGWWPNTMATPAHQRETITGRGKVKSSYTYLHKAASPQDRRRDKRIWARRSGPVLGERVWSTRNLQAKARASWDPEYPSPRPVRAIVAMVAARDRIERERAKVEWFRRVVLPARAAREAGCAAGMTPPPFTMPFPIAAAPI